MICIFLRKMHGHIAVWLILHNRLLLRSRGLDLAGAGPTQ